MEFTIKNIGIVEEATVNLDGLTVIAGSNNSGKTTIGKALYAVADAMARFDEEYATDIKSFASAKISNILTHTAVSTSPTSFRAFWDKHCSDVFPFVSDIFSKKANLDIAGYSDIVSFLYNAIENDTLPSMILEEEEPSHKDNDSLITEQWIQKKRELLDSCEAAINFLNNPPSKDSFAIKLIERLLRIEFDEQIQPIYKAKASQDDSSCIQIVDGDKEIFFVKIQDNRIQGNGISFSNGNFGHVFFVDDPYVVDKADSTKESAKSHRDKLAAYIHTEREESISETLYREKELQPIMEKVNEIVPGTLRGTTYLTENGLKLKASNLATGSKVFSILKKILENGDLTEKTLLILDEPESHLHPKWITRLAEVIVLLVKELNTRVLLTTHSPDFLLAVDAYMRKYQIQERCHFYRTEQIPEKLGVRYAEKTNDLDELYADYAASFAEMNALRKKCMDSGE